MMITKRVLNISNASASIADLNLSAYLAPLPFVFFDSTKSAIASITRNAFGIILTSMSNYTTFGQYI